MKLNKLQKSAAVLVKAVHELGPLSEGQMTDLLLDNIDTIKDTKEAKSIVKRIQKYVGGLAKTTKRESLEEITADDILGKE